MAIVHPLETLSVKPPDRLRLELTKQYSDPLSPRFRLHIRISEDSHVQRCLYAAELNITSSHVEIRIGGHRSSESCSSGRDSGGKRDRGVRKRGCDGVPDGGVECVVISKVDVVSGE